MPAPVRGDVEDSSNDTTGGPEAGDLKSDAKRERIHKGYRAVRGVHAKIAAATAKISPSLKDKDKGKDEDEKKDARPWHVVRAVEEAWGAGDRALSQVQDLLRMTASALADVTSVP